MKVIVREFDPNFPSKALSTTTDYYQEVMNLFDIASNKKTYELALQTDSICDWKLLEGQMDVPKGIPSVLTQRHSAKGCVPTSMISSKKKFELSAA